MKYGSAFMIVGILLLIVVLRRRGRKLKQKSKKMDIELQEWRNQVYQQYGDDNRSRNVNWRVRERYNGDSKRRK